MVGLIAAYTKNKVIGYNGKIPWKIKGEQQRFRKLTTGNIVIIGRKSYEEIGYPLPGRYTIVISRTKHYTADNCTTVASLDEALKLSNGKNVFIAGGGGLYKEALPYADKMYITLIDAIIKGDTFFPEFDASEWNYEENERYEGEIPYTYVTYTRKADIN